MRTGIIIASDTYKYDGMYMDADKITANLAGLIIYELSGSLYCANIKNLQTIINPSENLPGFRDMQLSIPGIQLYDLLFTFIDLYEVFSLEKKASGPDSRILLIEAGEKKIAFLVDRIIEIITLNEKEIQQKIKFEKAEGAGPAAGCISYNGHSYILPDYSSIAMVYGVRT